MESCNEHSGHVTRLERSERDIEAIWKKIDNMKNWVIAGMATVILQFGIFIFEIAKK